MKEREGFIVEAALHHGFTIVDDDASVFQCTQAALVSLVEAYLAQGGKGFAKVFQTQEHGQILVKKDRDDQGCPEVRFFFQPKLEGVGICNVAVTGTDNEKGQAAIDEVFEAQTQETAIKTVDHAVKELQGFLLAGGIPEGGQENSKEPV